MSTYCSQSDIEGEIQDADLIALTDDNGTGSLNPTVLAQAITNASNVIDSKLAGIYSLPFGNPVPNTVNSWAITIACYRLYRRRLTPDEKNNFYDDYRSVMKQLDDIRKGETTVDLNVPRDFSQVSGDGRCTPWGGGNYLNNSM